MSDEQTEARNQLAEPLVRVFERMYHRTDRCKTGRCAELGREALDRLLSDGPLLMQALGGAVEVPIDNQGYQYTLSGEIELTVLVDDALLAQMDAAEEWRVILVPEEMYDE